ncbi:hypothetical protein ACKZDW_07500 [Ralstonia syzygii subsp. celebesensis]|nr:hypothetical protein [Ralstonia syzygii]QQV54819.1 hypothetical protein JK151_11755 [Ralstonia syzygii subsp. celebesensis]
MPDGDKRTDRRFLASNSMPYNDEGVLFVRLAASGGDLGRKIFCGTAI